MELNQYQNPGSINLQPPQHNVGGNINGAFELRSAAVDRSNKRLDKYRKNHEEKEKTFEDFNTAKLTRDIVDTKKYLAKVSEQKQRKKSGRDKKDDKPGVGGLSKRETDNIMSKIRAGIKTDQKMIEELKRSKENRKTPTVSHFDPSQITGQFPDLLIDHHSSRNELLSEINPDELDIILNPGKYDETNSDMNSQNSQGQIIKEEASNSPRYTQLQPSSSQNPSQMPGLGHAYPNPYQNPYPGYYPNMVPNQNMSHIQNMRYNNYQNAIPPGWGQTPPGQLMPSTSASYQYGSSDADYQYMS